MKDKEMLKELCKLLGICTNTTNEKYLYEDIVLAINELKDSVSTEDADGIFTKLKYEIEAFKEDIAEYENDISSLERKIEEQESEIEKLNEKNDRFCKDLIDSKEYAKTLSEELNKKSNEIASLKVQIGLK